MSSSKELASGRANQRGKAFLNLEDKILCLSWLEISQDPVTGSNQKKEKLWERISAMYHNQLPDYNNWKRSLKSLQCRMANITKAINKFRGCVRAVERLNPSGASEMDIIEKAKELFAQDVEEKKGFLFDHVWPILKEAEKWLDPTESLTYASPSPRSLLQQGYEDSQGNQMESPTYASSSPPLVVNLSTNEYLQADFVDSNARPRGIKKEKMRRTQLAEKSRILQTIVAGNQEIVDVLKRRQTQREERLAQMDHDTASRHQLMMLQAENERSKLQLERQEKEVMEMDLKSIEDPCDREYFRRKKAEILARTDQLSNSSPFSFTQYEGGGVLPEY